MLLIIPSPQHHRPPGYPAYPVHLCSLRAPPLRSVAWAHVIPPYERAATCDTKNHPIANATGWFGNGWRTDLVSHTATVQYLQRWNVSRPGSGWDGVGPLRFVHANGSGLEYQDCFIPR